MGIGPSLAVEEGEHGSAQAELAVSRSVAVDVDVGDDLGGCWMCRSREIDRIGEAVEMASLCV